MKRPPAIKINRFQLARLLDKQQMDLYKEVCNSNVFCSHCRDTAKDGIEVEELILNDLNDIMIRGTCRVCNGQVGRIIEFGGDKAFYLKAMEFRKSLSG